MDDQRVLVERGLRVRDGRKLLVFDLDEFDRVLRQRARARDDRDHRFALPGGALRRQRDTAARI